MLEEMDKKYVLHTYPKNYVNFKQGNNATLFDENKKEYIDFTSGIGVVSVGHGNKQLADAIADQAHNLIHTSNLFAIEPQAELAKEIAKLSGMSVGTFFANSGAEANEGAIKLARKYGTKNFNIKKEKIISLGHSFHGRTLAALKATGQTSFHKDEFAPYPKGFMFCEDIKSVYRAIDDRTVAVMIELIQGEGGVEALDKQEVQELAQYLQEKEILLIVDEIQTGVYRSGEFLASKAYGITPDIITLAKGLAGGVPIGAILTTHKDVFEVGDHGSTFGGNYLSTRAGLEVLNILENYKNSGKMNKMFIYFNEQLKAFFQKHSKYFEKIVGLGLMRGVRCKEGFDVGSIITSGFNQGVLVLKAGRNTLRFLPPLTISKDEIDEGFKRLDDALENMA